MAYIDDTRVMTPQVQQPLRQKCRIFFSVAFLLSAFMVLNTLGIVFHIAAFSLPSFLLTIGGGFMCVLFFLNLAVRESNAG